MSSPAVTRALTIGVVNAPTAFNNLSANATQLATALSSSNNINLTSTVDWQNAQTGWQAPANAAVTDLQALAQISTSFVTALGTVLNATHETARVDPLWALMTSITTTTLTCESAFAIFLANTQAWAASYDEAAQAANVTNDPKQPLLDAYPRLTTAAAISLEFLKGYKTALGNDIAAVLLCAARGQDTFESARDLPPVLKNYKEQGSSNYTIDATMLNQLATAVQPPQRRRI